MITVKGGPGTQYYAAGNAMSPGNNIVFVNITDPSGTNVIQDCYIVVYEIQQ